jgi:UDP-glucose 4-epimerase
MNRILVTGGAGFIGSNIVDALVESGRKVHVLDDLSSGFESNLNSAAVFHRMDIRDREVSTLFADKQFDVLIHHAAQLDVRKSVSDPSFDADVNIRGFLNLLEAGRRNGLKQVVFASTGGAMYGEPDYAPQDENHPQRPLSPYGITKLCSEKYLAFYEHAYGIPYVALRYGNVYGPRQNPHGEAGVVAIFAKKMLAGEQPIINGDGLQTRDYVHVHDVVRANLAALKLTHSDIINIGTGVETSVNDVFGVIADRIKPGLEERHGPSMAGEQQRSVLSHAHAHEVLNWTPEVDVETGLVSTVEWFMEG